LKHRLSQEALGKAVGVTKATICNLEKGSAGSSKHLVKIAQALGVRPEWLAEGKGEIYKADEINKLEEKLKGQMEIDEHLDIISKWIENTPNEMLPLLKQLIFFYLESVFNHKKNAHLADSIKHLLLSNS